MRVPSIEMLRHVLAKVISRHFVDVRRLRKAAGTSPAPAPVNVPLTSTSLPPFNTVQDDAVMAGASVAQTVAAADGRTLTITEWGDPGAFPLFFLHGTPGSRFVGPANAGSYASVGARGPGYGGSDRFRFTSRPESERGVDAGASV